jgi:coproporphyrinogen III oxidase
VSAPVTVALTPRNPYDVFPFVVSAAEGFLPAYLPILLKNKDKPFTAKQKEWQQLRRGR